MNFDAVGDPVEDELAAAHHDGRNRDAARQAGLVEVSNHNCYQRLVFEFNTGITMIFAKQAPFDRVDSAVRHSVLTSFVFLNDWFVERLT